MAEEFENYEARLAEAHRAVERWETDGGARDTEQPAEKAPDTVPDDEAVPGGDRAVCQSPDPAATPAPRSSGVGG